MLTAVARPFGLFPLQLQPWFMGKGNLDGALQCVQGPGDLLFIPEGWAHAVLNIEDVLAAAIELPISEGHYDVTVEARHVEL